MSKSPSPTHARTLGRLYKSALPVWSRDEDLYTLVVERSLRVLKNDGRFGMILPLSLCFSTKKSFVALRRLVGEEPGAWWWSHFDRIPSALFGSEVRTRCTIALLARSQQCSASPQSNHVTTKMDRGPETKALQRPSIQCALHLISSKGFQRYLHRSRRTCFNRC
jgi:hypothetical protein